MGQMPISEDYSEEFRVMGKWRWEVTTQEIALTIRLPPPTNPT